MALDALDDSLPGNVVLEHVDCPMGCQRNDILVTIGRDRLHDLPGSFDVVKCRDCGLTRTNPRPDPASISFYYPDSYKPYALTSVKKSAGRTKQSRGSKPDSALLRWLKPDSKALPPVEPGRLLELGCASGSFLHKMAQAGWEAEGIELSEHAARQAREAGFKVRNVPVELAGDPETPFDVIVGWMVLEHLHEPLPVLQKLSRWTRKGGWLVLSVPDAGSLEFKVFKDKWYALQLPTHLHHFTPETLSAMLAKAGWSVERTIWQPTSRNTWISLSYVAADRNWPRAAVFFRDVADRRRLRTLGKLFGMLLGKLHQSGRMTVWAKRV